MPILDICVISATSIQSDLFLREVMNLFKATSGKMRLSEETDENTIIFYEVSKF